MDLRHCPRFLLHCPVTFVGEHLIGGGTVLNLSAGGWMMESDHSLEPGTFVGLRLSLPDLDAPMVVKNPALPGGAFKCGFS